MCGIFCTFSDSKVNITEKLSKIYQEFNFSISRRGPNQSKIEICDNGNKIFLFAASVLWLQGKKLTKQPINEDDYLLVYNGDIFDENSKLIRSVNGDTKLFLNFFKSNDLFYSLFKANGPFAFVCLDKENSILYFGRDKYGRRSLLIGKSDDDEIILTSVAKRNTSFKFVEVPSLGIFALDMKTRIITLRAWFTENDSFSAKLKELTEFLETDIRTEKSCNILPFKPFIEPPTKLLDFEKLSNSNDIFESVASAFQLNDKIQELKKLIASAIQKRILDQPEFCQDCIKTYKPCHHSILGVLFSGGVDCAILAYVAHWLVPNHRSIDLLNVAFSNDNFNTPDRITGYQTLKELQELCPERKWNFVEVNVTSEELDKERKRCIADLIYPLNTILDDGLGCALWFASRGISENYVSPARILLIGTGADELFGGYSRHQAAFKNGSWLGLHNVLVEDWQNLPYRNLGRDDRVVSDHGRQLRTPYLDEDLVEFVQGLSCWEKTLPIDAIPEEIRAKFFLRALAHQLGLRKAATLKKRALQFGSRIANSKENGHEISPRL